MYFIFWGIEVRLLTAGISQIAIAKFTTQSILGQQKESSTLLIKEFGLANTCIGVTGIISFFVTAWRPAVALIGGLFMGSCART